MSGLQRVRMAIWVFAASLVVAGGCSLFLVLSATEGDLVECTATLRNPSMAQSDGSVPELSVSNLQGEFLDAEGLPAVPYADGQLCAGNQRGASDALLDWPRALNRRIQLSADSDNLGIFRDGGCIVPATLSCTQTTLPADACADPTPEQFDPLPECEPPQPQACVRVLCDGSEDCALNFGDAGIGATATRRVAVANCGAAGAPAVGLRFDGAVLPDDAANQADFDIPQATNACFSLDDEQDPLLPGSACEFDVVFGPQTGGLHAARTVITAVAGVETQLTDIGLRGDGVPGDVSIAPADGVTQCFDQIIDGCTALRSFEFSNTGVGRVDFDLAAPVFVPADSGFELVDALPASVAPGDTASIGVRWCGPPANVAAALTVQFLNNGSVPTYSVPLLVTPYQCTPVAAYGMDEGAGVVTLADSAGANDGSIVAPARTAEPGAQPPAALGIDTDFGNGVVWPEGQPQFRFARIDLGTNVELVADELTLMLWVRFDNLDQGDQMHLIATADGAVPQANYWMLGRELPVVAGEAHPLLARLRVLVDGTPNTVQLRFPTPLESNVWTHLTLRYNGSAVSLFKNGALVGAAQALSGPIVNGAVTTQTTLGNNPVQQTVERVFRGALDEVRVFNRAVSDAEITEFMARRVADD